MATSGRDNQGERSAIEEMANRVGEGGIRRVVRSTTREAKPQESGAGDSSRGAEAIPGEVCRVQRAAFSREAARGTQYPAELHMGEEGTARSGAGSDASEARSASEDTGA